MRGKDINLTVLAGMSHVREIKALTESGETWPIENVSVAGELWDVRMDGVIARLECRVTEEGIIEVRFPEMEAGRYIFAVDGVSDDGQIERIIEGYIGYEGPEMAKEVINEVERGTELQVYIGKEVRRALFGRNKAWEEKYRLTQEVAGQLNEVDSKLERAERLNEEFDNKLRDFVVPNDATGTWVVGGVDTGKPYQGSDGIDGDKIRRIVVETVDRLPAKGDGGQYYYVEGRLYYYDFTGKGDSVFMYVKDAALLGEVSLMINGWAIATPQVGNGSISLYHWAEEINATCEGEVEATVTGDKWLKITSKTSEWASHRGYGFVYREESYKVVTYFTKVAPYAVYAWLEQGGTGAWHMIESGRELEAIPLATYTKPGSVQLTHNVSAMGGDDVPSASAVASELDRRLEGLVTFDDLEFDYVSKKELEEANYAKADALNDFVTDEELQEAIAREHSGLVSSMFGKKIVELSETEYSLLENPDEDTYYLTFAD